MFSCGTYQLIDLNIVKTIRMNLHTPNKKNGKKRGRFSVRKFGDANSKAKFIVKFLNTLCILNGASKMS